MSGALVVFAKEPRPGQVKTRLCPPFAPAEAAAFYDAMLGDVLEASALFAEALGLVPILAIDPPQSLAAFEARARPPFEMLVQRGPDLSARMAHAAEDAFERGHAPVLLRGSDSPAMDQATVEAALDALAGSDVVFCPDLDGGYNLVGLARPAPGLFDHAMSTASVLADSREHAGARNLSVATLAPGFDIDTVGDLEHLAARVTAGKTTHLRRTLSFLERSPHWTPVH